MLNLDLTSNLTLFIYLLNSISDIAPLRNHRQKEKKTDKKERYKRHTNNFLKTEKKKN